MFFSFAAVTWVVAQRFSPPVGEGALRDVSKQHLRRRPVACWMKANTSARACVRLIMLHHATIFTYQQQGLQLVVFWYPWSSRVLQWQPGVFGFPDKNKNTRQQSMYYSSITPLCYKRRTRTCDLPISTSDALLLSYRRLVVIRPLNQVYLTNILHTAGIWMLMWCFRAMKEMKMVIFKVRNLSHCEK